MLGIWKSDNPLDYTFYITIFIILIDFLLGSKCIQVINQSELEGTKKYFTGISAFFFTHGTTRTIYWFHVYFYTSEYFFYLGSLLGVMSVWFVIIALESTILTKSKHFFTVYGLIGLVIMLIDTLFFMYEIPADAPLFAEMNLIVVVQSFELPVLAGVIILLYLVVAIRATGEIRKNSLLMTLSVALFGVSEVFSGSVGISWLPGVQYFAPFIMMTALILIYYSVTQLYLKE